MPPSEVALSTNADSKIRELAQAGKSVRYIARRVRLHLSSVYRALARMGITRARGPLADRAKVVALVREHGPRRAAEMLKVTRAAIYAALQRWGA